MLIFFCAIGIFLIVRLTDVMVPKWTYTMDRDDAGEGTRYRDFYKLPDNTLDYIVVGTSHANYAVNPMQIYEETGYTGYVLAGEQQNMSCSYYWVLEAGKKHKLKAVFVDVSSLIADKDSSSLILKELLAMKPSITKFHAIFDCSPDMDTVYSALFPLYNFHDRWTDLNRESFQGVNESNYYLRGSALRFYSSNEYASDEVGIRTTEKTVLETDGTQSYSEAHMDISSDAASYLEKIIAYCNENDIQMIPVKCPTRHWNSEWTDKINAYLADRGANKIENMLDQDGLKFDWDTDTHDNGYHLNYVGNAKTSHWFAGYLKSMNIFTDHRSTDGIWNETADTYLKWERSTVYDCLYPRQKIYRYLSDVADHTDKYIVLLMVYQDAEAFYDTGMDELFQRMGFENGINPESQKSVVAVADRDGDIFSRTSYRKEELLGSFVSKDGEKHSYHIVSSGATSGKESILEVDGREYTCDFPGINMVVIDRSDGKVISRSAFGLDDKGKLCFEDHVPDGDAEDRLRNNTESEKTKIENGVLITNGNKKNLKFVSTDDGCYMIKDIESGMVLTPENFDNAERTPVTMQEETGLASQQWTVFTDSNGNMRILSLFADKYLAVDRSGNYVLTAEYGDESKCFELRSEHGKGKEQGAA